MSAQEVLQKLWKCYWCRKLFTPAHFRGEEKLCMFCEDRLENAKLDARRDWR